MSDDAVWISRGRRADGPHSTAAVRVLLRVGSLDPRAFAWSRETGSWQPLAELDWSRDLVAEKLAERADRRRSRMLMLAGMLLASPAAIAFKLLHDGRIGDAVVPPLVLGAGMLGVMAWDFRRDSSRARRS